MRLRWVSGQILLALIVALSAVAGEEPVQVEGGTLSLNPAAVASGEGERWEVQLHDAENGMTVDGTVRVTGVPIGRPDKLEKLHLTLSGSTVSGTVNANGGNVLAWFNGEVSGDRIHGTFTAVTGQTGAWEWEGPIPETVSGSP